MGGKLDFITNLRCVNFPTRGLSFLCYLHQAFLGRPEGFWSPGQGEGSHMESIFVNESLLVLRQSVDRHISGVELYLLLIPESAQKRVEAFAIAQSGVGHDVAHLENVVKAVI